MQLTMRLKAGLSALNARLKIKKSSDNPLHLEKKTGKNLFFPAKNRLLLIEWPDLPAFTSA